MGLAQAGMALPVIQILNKSEKILRRSVGMLAGGDQPVYASGEYEIDLARRELRVLGSPVPLGGRAFEIIAVLAQAAGELVTKSELMDHIWPGGIVLENTLHVHTTAIRKALGPYRGLLKTESGRGYRLLGSWTVRQHSSAIPPSGPRLTPESRQSAATNLPIPATGLVGRSEAVHRLRDLLSAYRVVTVTGPGGIGKTALALEVARRLLSEFDDGAWFVELAPLSDPDLVPSVVAGVLGLKLGGEEISAAALTRAIGDQKLLLLLDNCEHVIDAVATLAEMFVRSCPRTTILATSREVFRIDGEFVYRVPPLEVPAIGLEDPDHILRHSAVELFVARAKELGSDFSSDAESLPATAAICRHLDGIPLAVELAAACAAMLGVQQVAGGLHDRFALLTRGRRTALPRHRTLRATLDWSHGLLPEAERLLLRRLAIFPAGFTLDAAAAVMNDTGIDASAVTDGIANLVAKSLIMLDKPDGPTRWYLLETTRAYALEKLAEAGEASTAARHHAQYHRDLFEHAETEWEARPTAEWLADYGRQIDNLRAALHWGFSPGGDASIGVALTAAAVPLWMHLSLLDECRGRAEQALAVLSAGERPDPRREMKLHAALAASSWWHAAGIYARGGGPELIKALEIAESLGDPEYQLRSLYGLYAFHLGIGQFQAALESAQSFRALAVKQHEPNDRLIGERMIGAIQHLLGDQASSRRHIEHTLANFTLPEHRSHDLIRFQYDQRVSARVYLARILWLQGFPGQAMRTAKGVVDEAGETNHALSLCYALAHAACPTILWSEDLAAAERYIAMLLDHSTRHALPFWGTLGRTFQGVLAIKRGDLDPGLKLLRAGLDEFGDAMSGWISVMFLSELAAGFGRAGQTADGLIAAERAIERAERTEARWLFPESLRIKGELLLLQAANGAAPVAEAQFRQALDWARRQSALSLELRAATSLARLLRDQGRTDESLALLQPVYDRFTEGFETADLKAAKALLGALQ
jgi:predicted ATPase/DNA-binding winged helix-turn-helix (wHTH) protein